MKLYAIISLLIMGLFLESSCQNKLPKYGESAVQLHDVPFQIDIPNFLSNESIFENSNKVILSAEENGRSADLQGEDDKQKSNLYYIQYDVSSNDADINLANYRDFKFKTLELLTDVDEKEVFLWMAEQDEQSSDQIIKLLDQINKDYSQATISSKDLKNRGFMGQGLRMVWHTDDRIIQLVIPNLPTIELEDRDEEQEWQYDDYGNPIEKEEKEHFTKEELINAFKKALTENTELLDVTLFIADIKFDKIFTETSGGSSGTLTNY